MVRDRKRWGSTRDEFLQEELEGLGFGISWRILQNYKIEGFNSNLPEVLGLRQYYVETPVSVGSLKLSNVEPDSYIDW